MFEPCWVQPEPNELWSTPAYQIEDVVAAGKIRDREGLDIATLAHPAGAEGAFQVPGTREVEKVVDAAEVGYGNGRHIRVLIDPAIAVGTLEDAGAVEIKEVVAAEEVGNN